MLFKNYRVKFIKVHVVSSYFKHQIKTIFTKT